jgi:imidazolonepropionase-like amidohydrolase
VILVLLLAGAAAGFAQTTAIRNVTVIDVIRGEARRAHVIIAGPKITAVGLAARIPSRAKIIEGRGKFVIPGLWDMHVHLYESGSMWNLYTAHGITGVRDMGSVFERTRLRAKQALAGTGPRVFTSGSPVDGPGSESTKFPVLRVAGPEDGRRAADSLDTQGVDFLNVLSSLSRDAYFALAQRARVRRAIFAGNVPETVSIIEAIDARQRSIEHLFGIALACSSEEQELRERGAEAVAHNDTERIRAVRERTYKTFSEIKAVDLFNRMARYGVWQTPTLTLRKRDVSTGSLPRFHADYDIHRRIVKLMASNGVGILAGTDTGAANVIPGAALHDELALLVEAGLSETEALRAATLNAARFFNLEASSGTVDRGKAADLVILDANPLVDIRNTRRIRAVIVRGKLIERKRLDVMLSRR